MTFKVIFLCIFHKCVSTCNRYSYCNMLIPYQVHSRVIFLLRHLHIQESQKILPQFQHQGQQREGHPSGQCLKVVKKVPCLVDLHSKPPFHENCYNSLGTSLILKQAQDNPKGYIWGLRKPQEEEKFLGTDLEIQVYALPQPQGLKRGIDYDQNLNSSVTASKPTSVVCSNDYV